MNRTSRLAWSCTAVIDVDLGVFTEILVPFIRTPLLRIRQFGLRICQRRTVFQAELLAEFSCTNRTDFHTLAAGNTFLLVDMCAISGS